MNKIKFILSSLKDVIIYFYYKLYFLLKNTKASDVWLISERGIDARDNGYWFYKYMKNNHPEIPIKYVITKDSADYSKIDKEDVVLYRSKEHYYYFLFSKVLISAEIMGFSPNERLYYRLNKYGILKTKGKNVFLQHGITKDYNPYMTKENAKLDLFICGAIPEHEYMIEKYGYNEKEAVLTGFARFDNLRNLGEKTILIMPTWRKWLKYAETLKETDFYNNYMDILNDDEIISLLEKTGYKIVFYPHIILQRFVGEFSSKSDLVKIASFDDYDVQDLLKESSLLVTDYSSVAFDYAYMQKNVIYYQFDLKQYRDEQYSDGYYSYEEDGFGPVCKDGESTKKYIKEFLKNPKSLEEYNKRIGKFFKYSDCKNCERIYEKVKEIL